MQSRWISLLEAAVNVVAGLVLSFLLQLALFDAMAIAAGIGQSMVLTTAFSVLSMMRSYVLLRLFERFSRGYNRLRTDLPLEAPS